MNTNDPGPIEVGLAGVGPWARTMHAPMLAAGPETRLAAVWGRRNDAARDLARTYQAVAVTSYDELLDRCQAVALAVPPDVQPELAVRAARGGRALLLEKPLSLDLPAARALVDAVEESGVISQLVLTKRYHPVTREFLTAAAAFPTVGARACYLHGAFLSGEFATGWRLTRGALLDLGPHALDLVVAALGPIHEISAAGDPRQWVELTCEHLDGRISQISLSGSVGLPRTQTRIELYGAPGSLAFDTADIDRSECWLVLRREFATAVRTGVPHVLDARHGLMLQELIQRATDSLSLPQTRRPIDFVRATGNPLYPSGSEASHRPEEHL